ncbi:MAG: cobalt ECF transporter T component CbiQ [Austwickia sp.]|nr:cobalt ECF transporter T component CbiQ [Actinomycetota bacterium]MCB1253644.1 cobalt ECF transporter T component CbiQ [Austwickia sp.]MCO5309127.1 cobalt ECF transporter T component CbiQ [Austwickia sp.]
MHLTALDDAAWSSPWRRRPVADKALLSLGLVLTALLAPPAPGGLLVIVVALAALLGPARVPPRLLVEALGPPVAFVVLGALSVAVAVGAATPDAWWALGPLSMGPESAARGAGLVVHGVAGALGVLVLATTTPMVDLVTAARRLRIPAACLDIAALVYRLLFVLLDVALAAHAAQAARLGGSGRVADRLRAAGSLVGTVLVHSFARARRLTEGLAGRGYEDDLRTLPVTGPRSLRFEAVALAAITAVWLVVWVSAVGPFLGASPGQGA